MSALRCGHAETGRQAWLRAKWEFPMRVRVSLAAPKFNITYFLKAHS